MRPTKFSEELFENICNQISTTSIGLHKICKEVGISAVTFFEWIKEDAELSNRYARAREAQAELLADQIIEIADDSTNDTKTIVGKAGDLIEVENTEWTNRSKLRVEARKWIAAKLKPKKYGDKVEVDQTINVNKLPDWLSNDLNVEQLPKQN
jgi:hypothetical protein